MSRSIVYVDSEYVSELEGLVDKLDKKLEVSERKRKMWHERYEQEHNRANRLDILYRKYHREWAILRKLLRKESRTSKFLDEVQKLARMYLLD